MCGNPFSRGSAVKADFKVSSQRASDAHYTLHTRLFATLDLSLPRDSHELGLVLLHLGFHEPFFVARMTPSASTKPPHKEQTQTNARPWPGQESPFSMPCTQQHGPQHVLQQQRMLGLVAFASAFMCLTDRVSLSRTLHFAAFWLTL